MEVSWGRVQAAATIHVGRVGKRSIWDVVGTPEGQAVVADARCHSRKCTQPLLNWLDAWPDSL